jgi:hypothetical protein
MGRSPCVGARRTYVRDSSRAVEQKWGSAASLQIASDMLEYHGDNVARVPRTVTRQIITKGIPGRLTASAARDFADSDCR